MVPEHGQSPEDALHSSCWPELTGKFLSVQDDAGACRMMLEHAERSWSSQDGAGAFREVLELAGQRWSIRDGAVVCRKVLKLLALC